MNTFPLIIITPEGQFFEDTITSLIAPGVEGFLGILANHIPLVVQIKEGVFEIEKNNQKSFFSVGPGVLEVNAAHQALLLTDFAKQNNSAQTTQQKSHSA